ncbi:MAG TPA: rRNA maturation RNase YbeY [Ferruginibacter sp.]|nr:rRNA maturation RNase YbeY [Ferruginibacter sp.]
MAVRFHFQTTITLKDRRRLKAFIEQLVRKEAGLPVEIQFIFCSDEELLQINRDYLKHDYYTDIITFDLSEPSRKQIQSDIFISIDRVKENAQGLSVSTYEELHRVMFHGVLHLCGYKDKSARDQTLMRSKEDFYLKKYGFK